jgi:hypothetical protein
MMRLNIENITTPAIRLTLAKHIANDIPGRHKPIIRNCPAIVITPP